MDLLEVIRDRISKTLTRLGVYHVVHYSDQITVGGVFAKDGTAHKHWLITVGSDVEIIWCETSRVYEPHNRRYQTIIMGSPKPMFHKFPFADPGLFDKIESFICDKMVKS